MKNQWCMLKNFQALKNHEKSSRESCSMRNRPGISIFFRAARGTLWRTSYGTFVKIMRAKHMFKSCAGASTEHVEASFFRVSTCHGKRSKDLPPVSACHGKSSTDFGRDSTCHGKRCNSFKNDIASQKLTLARLIKTLKHFYKMSIFVLQNISGENFLVLELLGSKD